MLGAIDPKELAKALNRWMQSQQKKGGLLVQLKANQKTTLEEATRRLSQSAPPFYTQHPKYCGEPRTLAGSHPHDLEKIKKKRTVADFFRSNLKNIDAQIALIDRNQRLTQME